ncbi:MAG: hypothetical protein WCT51_02835 [Candidatus Shapirobacteria bacterium]
MIKTIHQQKHYNYIMLFLGVGLAILLSQNQLFNKFVLSLGQYSYISAIIAGAMFVCTFTVATGGLIILTLAKTLNPTELIFFGMVGAVIFDMFVFKSIKNTVDQKIKEVFKNHQFSYFKKILHTKYFAWMEPLIGILVFISPLPDELGISLLGLSKLKAYQFLFISILNHSIGMSFIVYAIKIIS